MPSSQLHFPTGEKKSEERKVKTKTARAAQAAGHVLLASPYY